MINLIYFDHYSFVSPYNITPKTSLRNSQWKKFKFSAGTGILLLYWKRTNGESSRPSVNSCVAPLSLYSNIFFHSNALCATAPLPQDCTKHSWPKPKCTGVAYCRPSSMDGILLNKWEGQCVFAEACKVLSALWLPIYMAFNGHNHKISLQN